jgi:hypothetical protein
MRFTCHVHQTRDSSDVEIYEGVNQIRPHFRVFGRLPIMLSTLFEHAFEIGLLPVYNLMPCLF